MCVCVYTQVCHLPENYNLQQTLLPNADSVCVCVCELVAACVYVNVCVCQTNGSVGVGTAPLLHLINHSVPSKARLPTPLYLSSHFLFQVFHAKATKVNNRKRDSRALHGEFKASARLWPGLPPCWGLTGHAADSRSFSSMTRGCSAATAQGYAS